MIKHSVYPLLLIVTWSVLVHLPGITSPLLDYHAYRQCQTASVARNYVRHGMHFATPEIDTYGLPARAGTEFPIYSYLLALLFKAFGIHEILGRLLSCLFAAWGAVYLYLFVRARLGERVGLWSALVMCAIPVHLYFTRSVQPEPMALWGLLGFLYYADEWLRHPQRRGAWILALLLGSMAPLLKLNFLYVLGPLWFFLGYERDGFNILKNVAWLSLLALIIGFTGVWYQYAKTAPVVVLPLSPQEQWTNLAPLFTWRLWRAQFISRVPEIVTTYSGLFLALVGFRFRGREKSSELFLWWIPISILYVALLGEYGLIHRYTLLPLTPLAAVWAALGISAAWERVKDKPLLHALLIILIIGIPVHTLVRIKHWYRVEYSYVDDARQVLAAVSAPDDLVVVATHDKPIVLYYVNRYGYSVGPSDWTPAQVDDLFRRGVRFVLIPLDENPNRLEEWKLYLTTHAVVVKQTPAYWLYRAMGSMERSRQG